MQIDTDNLRYSADLKRRQAIAKAESDFAAEMEAIERVAELCGLVIEKKKYAAPRQIGITNKIREWIRSQNGNEFNSDDVSLGVGTSRKTAGAILFQFAKKRDGVEVVFHGKPGGGVARMSRFKRLENQDLCS